MTVPTMNVEFLIYTQEMYHCINQVYQKLMTIKFPRYILQIYVHKLVGSWYLLFETI